MQDNLFSPTDSLCSPATNYTSRTMPAQTMELAVMVGLGVQLLQQNLNRNAYILACLQQQQQAMGIFYHNQCQRTCPQPYLQPHPRPYPQPYQQPHQQYNNNYSGWIQNAWNTMPQ